MNERTNERTRRNEGRKKEGKEGRKEGKKEKMNGSRRTKRETKGGPTKEGGSCGKEKRERGEDRGRGSSSNCTLHHHAE